MAGALYVSRIDGDPVDVVAVEKILQPYGDIEHEFRPNDTDVELYGLPLGGVFFRFAFYQDCGDAVGVSALISKTCSLTDSTQNLRNHQEYRFENRMEPHGEGPSRRPIRRNAQAYSQDSPAHRRVSSMQTRQASKTIHIGNLPTDINYRTLYQIFHHYGDIISCQILIKQPYYKQSDEGACLMSDLWVSANIA